MIQPVGEQCVGMIKFKAKNENTSKVFAFVILRYILPMCNHIIYVFVIYVGSVIGKMKIM